MAVREGNHSPGPSSRTDLQEDPAPLIEAKMKNLTKRQKEVLDFIRRFISVSGFPPTIREMARGLGVSAPRAIVKHLLALEKKGRIRRVHGASRGIELIPPLKPEAFISAGVSVPILGSIPAGQLDLAVEDMGESLTLDSTLAREGSFLLRVKGDSMIGDGILSGDLALILSQPDAEDGTIVAALMGDEATLKRMRKRDGRVLLEPSNPDYPTIICGEQNEQPTIMGKLKAVIRMF